MTEEWPEIDETRAKALRDSVGRWGLEPKNLGLFDQALTLSSHAFENRLPGDNERLEFLGDSIIGFLAASWLYDRDPLASEGELSKRKSVLVSRAVLGRRAKEMGLGDLLRFGKGEGRGEAKRRLSTLCSALEALVAAAHLDLGPEASREFVLRHVIQPCDEELGAGDMKDPKSLLQEFALKRWRETPVYETISETGPDHERRFIVEARVHGVLYGRGEGMRKKWAEAQAAEEAYKNLVEVE